MNVLVRGFCEDCRVTRSKGVTRILHVGKPSLCTRRTSHVS